MMTRLWQAMGRQLRHPTGMAGSVIGWAMVHTNRIPNRRAVAALGLTNRDHVLEIGFGPGESLATMTAQASGARIHGIDQSARMLAMAARRNRVAIAAGHVTLALGPFAPLPWPDRTFDKILLVNVVYFFDPRGHAMAEVHRVLRPGGRVVVYATDGATMQNWLFSTPHTHRLFDAEDLRLLLVDGGFGEATITVERLQLPFGVEGLLAAGSKALP
ncbi:class I SAM-dependent methyltransferase [Lichenifustis flavocetrariae]|uniref:Class I SAM-dependent methyltransferase n=1 Tax=Lichenifustis flavocetrariae TaxID=2949735 RepID=A0AA41Z4F9_9HYPH|nr:class I SAM-dependent methyltransferase [Lichenifustis flavocetrariae]MCW6512821.1 class I SAM-dependent methyltransferase [Lichenifustis flavocetrariae]